MNEATGVGFWLCEMPRKSTQQAARSRETPLQPHICVGFSHINCTSVLAMKYRVFLPLLLIAFSSHLALAAGSAPACHEVLTLLPKLANASFAAEVKNAEELSSLIMNEIRTQSAKMKAKLRDKNSNEIFDIVIIGAGGQAAAASLVAQKSNQKVLVLERSNTIASNFADKDFLINSTESSTLSMHELPGGIAFNLISSQKYANSTQLATYIQANQFKSGIPVLLETEVTGLQMQNSIVEIRSRDGLSLRARKVLFATGMGDATTKISDPFYRSLFRHMVNKSELDHRSFFSVMTTESFLRTTRHKPSLEKKLVLPDSVILIGNGDGARIVVEEFLEAHLQMPSGFRIHWIGNEAKTAEQYAESQGRFDRYLERVVPHYRAGRITGVAGHAKSLSLNENGELVLAVLDAKTGISTTVRSKMIIDSTGYENSMMEMIKLQVPGSKMSDIRGNLPEMNLQNTILARQIRTADDQELPYYFLGISSGPIASMEEIQTTANRNPMSLMNNIPRTSQFVSQLLNVTPPPRHFGKKSTVLTVQPAKILFDQLREK